VWEVEVDVTEFVGRERYVDRQKVDPANSMRGVVSMLDEDIVIDTTRKNLKRTVGEIAFHLPLT
jgi:hypothetical protein